MSRVRIDWSDIRPLNGSRATGFEELCAQLARSETPAGSRFIRKGTPDAGVECYAILGDGSEWGWQSKYFDVLEDSQWSQINDSVITALEKHPHLVQYFVCIPLDLPDGRVGKRRSTKERWDRHVQRWTERASARGMSVEFKYWGSHELLERLSQPQHVGRVRFWFDVRGFDRAWFSARLEEALQTAGPRYTPEIHVELPIAGEFEAFGRTRRFFNGVKKHGRAIRSKLRGLGHSDESVTDSSLVAALEGLAKEAETVLAGLSSVEFKPIGPFPFSTLAGQVAIAEEAIEGVERLLVEREEAREAENASKASSPHSYLRNPFRDRRIRLYDLSSELREAHETLIHADRITGSSLMLIRGEAGTGKTHLLCDVARQRVAANMPTVLLLGQRFVSHDAPWTQALQQLDVPGLSAEEFVGALEAAAQASGSRALLLIDALNEGSGRSVWPSHLPAFLAHLERSLWIGVVLSVRSSYEDIVIPEEVRKRCIIVTHQGFAEHEYDAARTFFVHYGLELPSTPFLAPEFRNPLFLKTLCLGLKERGDKRLPRGFHGITAVFELYLAAINSKLASDLGFDRRSSLVQKALEEVSKALVEAQERWLTLDKASEIVNTLLPSREFERSLYRGMVVEGILVEESMRFQDADRQEIVFIAYDRLADHLVAKTLLDSHLDVTSPTAAFGPGGGLAFLVTGEEYVVAPGLLEALSVQVPERTGQELIKLAPGLAEHWGIRGAFRRSLVWRAATAFSESTRQAMTLLCQSEHDLYETLDALLTVATLPGHPFNAIFLNERLRRDGMPDRDAWWSTYLHNAWGNRGAVDRLVDWAWSVTSTASIEDEVVDLCSTSLAWMFTTSNRLLRDRATKALVSLLTGRIPAVGRLIDRFAGVDDPYVGERVYAVAYGVAMRCHVPDDLGVLAERVYSHVFSNGTPPPHILLRDYARGVIERAMCLGADVDMDMGLARPPYRSEWPIIPAEEEIKLLRPDWSRGAHDDGDLEWSRNRIGASVLSGDFARYVIGTNSSSASSHWLALRLDEPAWEAPERQETRLRALVDDFSEEERKSWEMFEVAERAIADASWTFPFRLSGLDEGEVETGSEAPVVDVLTERLGRSTSELEELEVNWEHAARKLESALTPGHAEALKQIRAMEDDFGAQRPPGFSLAEIQRYILWRVFDLGWTVDRFGKFDRFMVEYQVRSDSKAERIGKKYQWIAYYEIMGLISDHFQFREEFSGEDGVQAYDGPWQIGIRDIDPSCTLSSPRGGTSWEGHSSSWWSSATFENWCGAENPSSWVSQFDDIPDVAELLVVTNNLDGSRWFNAQGYLNWQQRPPADRDSSDVERRDLWILYTGYLIREEDAQAFLQWAEGVDFWGRWMPEPPEVHSMFLGEHGWAPASQYFQRSYYGDPGWVQPNHGCPVRIRTLAFEYLREAGGFDCSVDESYTLRLPAAQLVSGMGLSWFGSGAEFWDSNGRLVAFDPTTHAEGPNALLFREELLQEFLVREQLTVCWTVLGEKRVLSPGFGSGPYYPSLEMSGAYLLGRDGPAGFLRCMLNDRSGEERALASRTIAVIRTPELTRVRRSKGDEESDETDEESPR